MLQRAHRDVPWQPNGQSDSLPYAALRRGMAGSADHLALALEKGQQLVDLNAGKFLDQAGRPTHLDRGGGK